MPFNTQSTSKFAVLEFGAGTQPKATSAPKKGKEGSKKEEKSSRATVDSEGEGKAIENLILTTLDSDGMFTCLSCGLRIAYVNVTCCCVASCFFLSSICLHSSVTHVHRRSDC